MVWFNLCTMLMGLDVPELLKLQETVESNPTWQKMPDDVRKDKCNLIYREIADNIIEKAKSSLITDTDEPQAKRTGRKPRTQKKKELTTDQVLTLIENVNKDPFWEKIPAAVQKERLSSYWEDIANDIMSKSEKALKPPAEKPAKKGKKAGAAE